MAQSQIITAWGASFLRGNWRYVRNSFGGQGQDSFTQPPSQNEDQLQSTLNVLPPLDGGFRPRWGYTTMAELVKSGTPSAGVPIFTYQNDSGNYRNYVIPIGTDVNVVSETGSILIEPLYSPVAQPRMVTSRSYGYFASGVGSDLVKWDGTDNSGNVTNWGIAAPFTASSGPNIAGAGSNIGSGVSWTSPNNVTSASSYAVVGLSSGFSNAISKGLLADTFGFSITAAPIGIQVSLDYIVEAPSGPSSYIALYAQLVKAGAPIGTPITIFSGSTDGTLVALSATIGGVNNLWGTSLTAADVNASTFGVAFYAQQSPVAAITTEAFVKNVKMTVFEGTPITATVTGSGQVTLVSGRVYFCAYQNATTGHVSDLSSPTTSTGPVTSQTVALSNIPTSTDAQVSNVLILATPDGGDEETLYYVGSVANGVTTFTDNTPEETLVANNLYLGLDSDGNEVGISFNDPPPADLQFPIKHRGRLYGVSARKSLYFTKAESELVTPSGLLVGKFEECWPTTNFFDISEGAEDILGLLSDGQVLYIGTEKRIIRLFGDGPSTFLIPEALFENVGILNQDVWKMVFLEGNPVGAMWLTHDLRVVGSDFNTYQDIGTPVQDVLNTINPAVAQNVCWASYAALGQFNFYMLGIPTGSNTLPDTVLVFDLKQRQWYTWKLTATPLGGSFNVALSTNSVQNLFVDSIGRLHLFDSTLFTDSGNAFPVSVQTSWTAMGDPAARKYLNEVEVTTGALDTLVTVEGASTTQDFASPHAIVTSAALVQKPLGPYFVSLAGYTTKDRYYRLTFASTSSGTNYLRGYNVEGIVLDRV